jgi:DNA-binding transcriptional ArsR family regulator
VIQGKRAAGMARALSEPLRLQILVRLLSGSATVAELVAGTGSTQPNVSNHLAVLRREGLVRGKRAGRQVRYGLAGPAIGQLVEALATVAGSKDRRPPPASPLAEARSCYDHLAGRLGVSMLEALVRRGALAPPGGAGVIDMGPKGVEVFGTLGVDPARAATARRRFAFACLDWTERKAHLGGALGAELLAGLFDSGWVLRQPGTRALLVTAAGRRRLGRTLGI